MVIHEKLSKEQLLAVAPMVASTQDLLLWDVDAMPQSMAGMDMSHRYRACVHLSEENCSLSAVSLTV